MRAAALLLGLAGLSACDTTALPDPVRRAVEREHPDLAVERCARAAEAAAAEARANGGDRGDADRAADESLDRCQRADGQPPIEPVPAPPCVDDENRTTTEPPAGTPVVYYSCGGEVPAVRWLLRPDVDPADPAAVFRAWLDGPTDAERERGYAIPLGGGAEAIRSVRLVETFLTIDLAAAPFGPSAVGTTAGTDIFLAQVRWTAFANLDRVEEVRVTVEGECFGGEIGCVTLLRGGGTRVT